MVKNLGPSWIPPCSRMPLPQSGRSPDKLCRQPLSRRTPYHCYPTIHHFWLQNIAKLHDFLIKTKIKIIFSLIFPSCKPPFIDDFRTFSHDFPMIFPWKPQFFHGKTRHFAWIKRNASERCAAVGDSDEPCRRRASREACERGQLGNNYCYYW